MVKHKAQRRQPVQTPENTVSKNTAKVSPEFNETADRVLASFAEFVKSGGQTPTEVFVQKEAFSEAADAEREAFLAKFSERVGFDVDARLRNYEYSWREAGYSAVVVEPWMKAGLGLDDPETPVLVDGARREVIISTDDNNLVYKLVELEIPNRIIAPEGDTDNLQRVMHITCELPAYS